MSASATVWNVCMTSPAVRQQIFSDSRSSCTEGCVAKVGARPTDEKRIHECQPIAVFLDGRQWRGSSRQPGSRKHVQTPPGGPACARAWTGNSESWSRVRDNLHRSPRSRLQTGTRSDSWHLIDHLSDAGWPESMMCLLHHIKHSLKVTYSLSDMNPMKTLRRGVTWPEASCHWGTRGTCPRQYGDSG